MHFGEPGVGLGGMDRWSASAALAAPRFPCHAGLISFTGSPSPNRNRQGEGWENQSRPPTENFIFLPPSFCRMVRGGTD